MRGTTNSNARGSSSDRKARKVWLLETYAADHRHLSWIPMCRCYRCGDLMDFDTMTIDRIIPGCRGGTYRRNNIRPACGQCNSETGGRTRR